MPAKTPDSRGEPRDARTRESAIEPERTAEEYLAVAGSILEGERIDWEKLRPAPGTKSHQMLEQLRLLQSVTDFHRSAQRGEAPTTTEWDLTRWGHLEIIEPIGSGSFGTVYHAWDPKLDREVALKILDQPEASAGDRDPTLDLPTETTWLSPRARERTINEARLLARVHHPNVVTVFGADEQDGVVGIWMELIEGETLWRLVRRQGPLGAGEAIAIGHDLLGALAAAHRAGVLHRDIKPQNVMRARGGRIVLMDFGLGEDLHARRGLSMDRALGAALYSAPERLRGGKATIQSDLYSLGVLLYFLVTGRHPVEAKDLVQLLEAHERGERTYLRDRRPDLPRSFVEVIERVLRSESSARYGSAGEMDLALTAAGTGAPAVTVRARRLISMLRVPRLSWRRAAWLLPLPLLALVAILLGSLGRYSVEAALYRRLPGGGQASLTSRDAVAPGDQLFLELRATRDLYLYVVRRDQGGAMRLLFPSPLQKEPNPLRHEVIHTLPNLLAGWGQEMQEPGANRRDRFLFIASPRKIEALEARGVSLEGPAVRTVPSCELAGGLGRSVPALPEETPECERMVEEIFLKAPALGPEERSIKGTWIRKLELGRRSQ